MIGQLWTLFIYLPALVGAQAELRGGAGSSGRSSSSGSGSRSGSRVVSTKYGRLRGIRTAFPDNAALGDVDAYLGIEYASLMGGALRFMPPSGPAEKWRGIREAAAYKPVCPQRAFNESRMESEVPAARLQRLKTIGQFLLDESEECLYLNVYVPVADPQAKLPVMVFVHGESYDYGSGNAYDGSVLAAFGQVVVITLNYRLGALGFLAGSDGIAGNYALFDVIAALHWIKANINDFNGDAERVTVFGQGHGAAIVHMLSLSPVVKDMSLFHRAILQSGTALSSWSLSKSATQTFESIAKRTDCAGARSKKECVKKVPAKALMNLEPAETGSFSTDLGPVVDGGLLFPVHPELLANAEGTAFSRVEMMLGVGRAQGLAFLSQMQLERGVGESEFGATLKRFIGELYSSHQREIYEIITHQYSNWERVGDGPESALDVRDKLAEILSDALYLAPAIKTSLAHAAFRDTFLYVFAHSSEYEKFPEWSGGAPGEDLAFIFGAPLKPGLSPFPTAFTPSERTLSEAVMRMWTNFAKTGNPNFPASAVEQNNAFSELFWPKYDEVRQDYFQIGMRPAVHHHYRNRKVALWLQLVTKLQTYAAEDDFAPAGQGQTYGGEGFREVSERNASTRGLEVRHAVLLPIPPPPPPPFVSSALGSSPTTERQSKSSGGSLVKVTAAGEATPDTRHVLVYALATSPVAAGGGQSSSVSDGTSLDTADVVAEEDVASSRGMSFSMLVTVVTGCSLLVVNAIVLAAILYWRRRRAARGKYYVEEGGRLGHDPGPDGGSPEQALNAKNVSRKPACRSGAGRRKTEEENPVETDAGSRRRGHDVVNGDCFAAGRNKETSSRHSDKSLGNGQACRDSPRGQRRDHVPQQQQQPASRAAAAASARPCNGSLKHFGSSCDSKESAGDESKRRLDEMHRDSGGTQQRSRGECDSSSELGVTMV